jgi:hypothetical protein
VREMWQGREGGSARGSEEAGVVGRDVGRLSRRACRASGGCEEGKMGLTGRAQESSDE